jgi:hypothetical protein
VTCIARARTEGILSVAGVYTAISTENFSNNKRGVKFRNAALCDFE